MPHLLQPVLLLLLAALQSHLFFHHHQLLLLPRGGNSSAVWLLLLPPPLLLLLLLLLLWLLAGFWALHACHAARVGESGLHHQHCHGLWLCHARTQPTPLAFGQA